LLLLLLLLLFFFFFLTHLSLTLPDKRHGHVEGEEVEKKNIKAPHHFLCRLDGCRIIYDESTRVRLTDSPLHSIP
jgi:hypothetical protein